MINSVTGSEIAATSRVDREVNKTLGQEDFIRLLVTQLQYQDPLKPMEHTEFVTQLSQFSSLDHLSGINSGIKILTDTQRDMNSAQAINLIGKNVKASGSTINMDDKGGATGIGYQLNNDATEVVISIFNKDGKPVTSIKAGPQSAGFHTALWDGKDYSGNIMPAGEYNFSLSAKDVKGDQIKILSNVMGIADSVLFEGDVPYLTINGLKIPVSDIEEIKEVNRL
ncbi:MAG TPA: flagellar hook capping FlgD N-terminal domain-containing protein [Nitrospirota bacterium]|nr:flagellar hook capping FlgD N-terminal domain-containing protein [Nitrospirota bacterium]